MAETGPTPPTVEPPVWDAIPARLANAQQWVLWKFEWDTKRSAWLKVPYYVSGGRRTGGQGSDRDRERLATLPVVRRAFERASASAKPYTGIGFGFLPGDGLIGIDLDKCLDPETGQLAERAAKIVQAFHSFTELSPSGKGLHIYLEGHTTTAKSNDIGVEMFCEKQYFTVTGRHYGDTPAEVLQADEGALRRMHATIEEAKKKYQAPAPARAPVAPAAPPSGAATGGDDFAKVNAAAMAALHAWVPALFGGREQVHGQGYRVTSKALGRDLQEDLAIHPTGIKDWGVADMGDRRGGARSPVDLVMEWGPGTSRAVDALKWLAKVLGIELQKPQRANVSAPAGGAADAKAPAPAPAVAPAPAAPAGGGGGEGGGAGQPAADDEPGDIYDHLVMHKGRPMDCRENVMYCLLLDPEVKGLVRLNDFTRLIERSRTTPWGHPQGEWNEEDDLMLGEYLLRKYRLSVKAKGTLRDGVTMAARSCRFNPVADRIKAEAWDGEARLETWLPQVYGVEDRPYTRLIGKCFFMGLVKRAIQPGCKFDYMLIIKGEQRLTKSSAFRAIADPFFTDNGVKVGEKDSLMAQQLAWIVESAELESMNKADTTAIKQYLSAQEDWYRPPYGAQLIKAPRHFVNVGTTNADTFLKDATGDRRFWPLEVTVVHLAVLRAMVAQLLAEALHRLEQGEQYWPTREEEKALIFPEQEQFKRTDVWEDMLHEYVNAEESKRIGDPAARTREFFPTTELYTALNIKADRIDGAGNMDERIARAMKALGFVRHRETKGQRRRGFQRVKPEGQGVPPPPAVSAPQQAPSLPPGPFNVVDGDDDLPL